MESSRAAVLLVVVAASSLAVALSHGDDYGGPEFSYIVGSKNGPENWGKLSPHYRLCGEGRSQSPVDINTNTVISRPELESLDRSYDTVNATLINNGKDITMTFDGKVGDVTIMEEVYTFKMIHWHAPSEHTINGMRYPLELHMVHVSDDGGLAVISILYKLGAADPFYLQLHDMLENLNSPFPKTDLFEREVRVPVGPVQLRSLEKRTGNYFRYIGSLTTPPCTENVVWNVLGKVREISKEQLDLITAPLPHKDARPAQPLNHRDVYFYNPPNSTISFLDHL
ncbi:hypothetical protein GUJ93_ZPchr0009g2104 [Zizania palustris]|uniref:Carbonic anhydrase n=1 Tax=Zizania palustris TaxID=103762 RepID=A0A8J5VMV6_ZIZPA|nr:hypothetical protein GUJ93_ZPchr0009g2104 [Zizania palustris]